MSRDRCRGYGVFEIRIDQQRLISTVPSHTSVSYCSRGIETNVSRGIDLVSFIFRSTLYKASLQYVCVLKMENRFMKAKVVHVMTTLVTEENVLFLKFAFAIHVN